MAEKNAADASCPVSFLAASAEAIPLEGKSVDTVVTTWTLCTIPLNALSELRRVLKPGGKFLFVEHGLPPETGVQRWQNRLDPIWSRISGGCHINRPIRSVIEDAGFTIEKIEIGYFPGPRVMGFFSEGRAKRS